MQIDSSFCSIKKENALKNLISRQHEYINYFFNNLDFYSTLSLIDTLLACKGVIILSGVGKSGIVAQKIATTMTSTGTKALFLSPMDALHGDMGVVDSNDIFILISKSGETDELCKLLPFIKQRGVTVISWVSNKNSRLAEKSDLSIFLPLKRELCPFDLAPMTSAAIQMLFGDILAVALMERRGFSIDEYAENHPSGQIGKRITYKVKDLMLSGEAIPICHRDNKVIDLLVELSNKRCGCLLVVDVSNTLQGIFTDGDLSRALKDKGAAALNKKIEDLMTSNPKFIQPDSLAWEAMKLMESDPEHPITVLPVIKNNIVVGIIKMHDIVSLGL